MEKTIGGDRIGSGKKMKVHLHNYERSTHDLSHTWRSSMASGTLVPFLKQLALPGDTFDIDLNASVLTHPTIGPLFGSFKVQLDIYQCPIRLYQGKLHNNALGIGLNMASVKLPQIRLKGLNNSITNIDNNEMATRQVNPSSIMAYLGIMGIGTATENPTGTADRIFNAIPYIAYWDIYKNFYANKQEEVGYVIHHDPYEIIKDIVQITQTLPLPQVIIPNKEDGNDTFTRPTTVEFEFENRDDMDVNKIYFQTTGVSGDHNNVPAYGATAEPGNAPYFSKIEINPIDPIITLSEPHAWVGFTQEGIKSWQYLDNTADVDVEPKLKEFFLSQIDEMRDKILTSVNSSNAVILENDFEPATPYMLPLMFSDDEKSFSLTMTQEGLAIKTYQSDLFNNWMNTEWLDGENGINAITAVDTSSGEFTIDTLRLAEKVNNMLNRIAISGGTYDDWLDAVYTHDRYKRCETPMYMGGLSKELVFQEVISNSTTELTNEGRQPLGTLAGRGVMAKKHKGGTVRISVDEPSYIIGIVSLTPRIDYSQGIDWDTNLKTMDDLHKPALDQIGFQDLITEQMAYWDTHIQGTGSTQAIVKHSAGKQPAWLNYMTETNKAKGNFAIENSEMFMTLNRRYEAVYNAGASRIADLTTYIDPVKFNHIFADTRRDAQNFWTQISIDMKVRRKMSAKIMPNL